MIAKTDITEIIHLATGEAHLTWYLADELPEDTSLITQCSGYCLLNGKFAIVRKKNKTDWVIPGGKPDPGETPAKTFEREVWEEAYLKVKTPEIVGFHRIEIPDGSVIIQTRWLAEVESVEPFLAEHEIEKVKFVAPEEFGKYIPWWDASKSAGPEIEAAINKAKDRGLI